MYCRNCGKETSDAASFCPYCGAKATAGISETKEETVTPIQMVSNANEDKVLPVYKRKNKMAFLVAFIPLICIVCRLIVIIILITLGVPNYHKTPIESIAPDEILENNEGGTQ